MSSGFSSFAMASLLSERFSGFGVRGSGATTSMSGLQGLEAVRDAHLTCGMEDFFEIDTDIFAIQLPMENRRRAIIV